MCVVNYNKQKPLINSFFIRVAGAVGVWVGIAKAEIVKDPIFQQFLHRLQDSLSKHELKIELQNLNISLMDSIKRTSIHESGKGSAGISLLVSYK